MLSPVQLLKEELTCSLQSLLAMNLCDNSCLESIKQASIRFDNKGARILNSLSNNEDELLGEVALKYVKHLHGLEWRLAVSGSKDKPLLAKHLADWITSVPEKLHHSVFN